VKVSTGSDYSRMKEEEHCINLLGYADFGVACRLIREPRDIFSNQIFAAGGSSRSATGRHSLLVLDYQSLFGEQTRKRSTTPLEGYVSYQSEHCQRVHLLA
jgi:hypothetical protein